MTPILGLAELAAAQSQPNVPVNAALRTLEVLAQLTVTAIANDPPGSPADGARYIVGSAPTGVWVGHANAVAYYSSGWLFAMPDSGWLAYVKALGQTWRYTAGSPGAWAFVF